MSGSTANARARGGVSRFLRAALPWLLTLAIAAFLVRRWDLQRVADTLSQARWGLFFALMLPWSMAYLALDTAAVTEAARRFLADVRWADVLPARAATYVLSLVNGNVAQGGLAVWLAGRLGAPVLASAGVFLFLAFVEISQLVLYSSVGVALTGTRVPGLGRFYVLAWAVLVGWLAWAARRPERDAKGTAGLLSAFSRARIPDYLAILGIKSVSLALAILVHWRALRLFGIEVPLVALLANLPLIFLASAVPLSAGKLHASVAWALLLGGYAAEEKLGAYSLASHLTFLVSNALLGLAFVPRVGREIWDQAERYARSRGGRSEDAEPRVD
ncbi:MAG: hypothetical protein ACKOCT_16480 [Alphaproteobacteria bacterium]